MIDKEGIPEEYIQRVAGIFKAFGHPLRLKIIRILKEEKKNVKQLTELLDSSQANISKHLKVLEENNVLSRENEGTSSYYQIAENEVLNICSSACDYIRKVIREETEFVEQIEDSETFF